MILSPIYNVVDAPRYRDSPCLENRPLVRNIPIRGGEIFHRNKERERRKGEDNLATIMSAAMWRRRSRAYAYFVRVVTRVRKYQLIIPINSPTRSSLLARVNSPSRDLHWRTITHCSAVPLYKGRELCIFCLWKGRQAGTMFEEFRDAKIDCSTSDLRAMPASIGWNIILVLRLREISSLSHTFFFLFCPIFLKLRRARHNRSR